MANVKVLQKRGPQRTLAGSFPPRPAAGMGDTRPYTEHDPTNESWTWRSIINPLSEAHKDGAGNLTKVLRELHTAGKEFNAATKVEISKTVYCPLGEHSRRGIQNVVSVLRTTNKYCEDGIKELKRTSRFIDRMVAYDVGGDRFADGKGFLSTRKDGTYSQVWDGHHRDDILIGTGFRGDGSLEPTNVFIASTSTIEACCKKHKDRIKANGGIVSYRGGPSQCGTTNCCGSTISLEVGGDKGAWWKAVGALVRRKTSQAAQAEQKRPRVEESSKDTEESSKDTDLWSSRDAEESSMDTEMSLDVEEPSVDTELSLDVEEPSTDAGEPSTDAGSSHDAMVDLESAYQGEAADE